jgi:hypothetical protein
MNRLVNFRPALDKCGKGGIEENGASPSRLLRRYGCLRRAIRLKNRESVAVPSFLSCKNPMFVPLSRPR